MTETNDIPRPAAFATKPPTHVLFLCIHNACRSQIAEGFAHAMAPPGVTVTSAGTQAGSVHPMAVQVMQEAGIDIGAQKSKQLAEVPWAEADTVVTLCGEASEQCPTVGGQVRRVHWALPDPAQAPAAQQLEAFREARDEIRWRVASLWPRGD